MPQTYSQSQEPGSIIDQTLKQIEHAEYQFRNHPFWNQVGQTPEAFFATIKQEMNRSGLPQHVLDTMVAEQKAIITTEISERNQVSTPIKLKKHIIFI